MDQILCDICRAQKTNGKCRACISRNNLCKSTKKRIDIVGNRYGKLVVISYSHTQNNLAYWNCCCDCGNTVIVAGRNLKKGYNKSCSCLRKLHFQEKHKLSNTNIYQIWSRMKDRCYNHKNPNYKNYGGRGITVCGRWVGSFSNFLEDMGLKPDGKSLDRIDNDGNYEPGNCRWATKKEQQRNQRRAHYIEAFGKKQCIIQWAEETGINSDTIRSRLKNGWTAEDALTKN